MSTQTPARRPAGSPAGGQFAPTSHAESALDLADASPAPVPRPTGEAGQWVARAEEGIDQMARDSGTEWEVMSFTPLDNGKGVVVRAREDVSGEIYRIEAGSTFVSVKSDSALTGAMAFTLETEPVDDVSKLVTFHLDGVRRQRQTERMLAVAASTVHRPEDVRLDHGWQGPLFTRGKEQLQFAAGDGDADLQVFVTAADPVTGAPVEQGYDIRMDGHLRVTPQLERPGEFDLTREQVSRLCEWTDGMTGDEGFLWRVSVSSVAARPGPGYAPDTFRLS